MFCEACEYECGPESECMCPTYRKLMEEGQYDKVPIIWILNQWEYQLSCPKCKASYWPQEDCDCAVYRANPSVAPSWWTP